MTASRIAAATVLVWGFQAGIAVAAPGYEPSADAQQCLDCHSSEGMTLSFADGKEMDALVDTGPLGRSVHKDLGCSDCHSEFSAAKHPERSFRSRREFTEKLSQLCTQCHSFDSGPHAVMMSQTEPQRVCVDCHGSHGIQPAAEAGGCMACHKNELALELANGEKVSVHVDPAVLAASVHADVDCTDCHEGYSGTEHPKRDVASARAYELQAGEVCKSCHFDKYTRNLEGIHYKLISEGRTDAPGCIDCHGAHDISSGRQEKLASARRCQKCHSEIYETYSHSVHGSALLEQDNQDVPVCSDCHKAHDIHDPRTVDFRNETPQMCGNCHTNKDLMKKYGLSTAVLSSYLEDFHGVTVTFYKEQGHAVRHIAVCTDCHGIHDITKTSAHDATVLKANLVARCQKCHPDATENFPDTWLAHYEPTFRRAPLVWLVDVFYRLFIPFMITGLVLQILLHIWRYAVKR